MYCTSWEKTHGRCVTPDAPPPPLPPPSPGWPPLPPLAPGLTCTAVVQLAAYLDWIVLAAVVFEFCVRARVSAHRHNLRIALLLMPLLVELGALVMYVRATPQAVDACTSWARASEVYLACILAAIAISAGCVALERTGRRASLEEFGESAINVGTELAGSVGQGANTMLTPRRGRGLAGLKPPRTPRTPRGGASTLV